MNNKINLAIIVIAAAALLAVGNAQTGNQGPIGRYQLVAGEHEAAGSQSTATVKAILRIDTVTGQTSVWTTTVQDNGTVDSFWSTIPWKSTPGK
jgi:hypothetical protein